MSDVLDLFDVVSAKSVEDPREKAIRDRNKVETGSDVLKMFGEVAANKEIEARRKQRDYAVTAPREIFDAATEMVTNLGDRQKVLGVIRNMTPEQRDHALYVAGGVAQQLGNDRGGMLNRAAGAIQRGVSHGVSQPLMELMGMGGTPEEIEYIRKLDATASQEFNPSLPSDPALQRGALQATEMLPWMATVVGGAGAGTGVAKTGGQLLARGAASGVPGATAAFKAVGAAGKLPTLVGRAAATTKGTLETAGSLAGITAASFPGQYAQEVDQLKQIGMKDGKALRWLATGTAAVTGLIEGIVPNPFKVEGVSLTQGAATAARQYMWNALKSAPGEMTEEYLQGVTSGLGKVVAGYIDEKAQDKTISDAFNTGWDQMKEAALPMAFLLGVPAIGGASASAAQARRIQLEQIRAKGFVSASDAKAAGIEGNTRKERAADIDAKIEQAKAEEAQAKAVESQQPPQEVQPAQPDQIDANAADIYAKRLAASQQTPPPLPEQSPGQQPPPLPNQSPAGTAEVSDTAVPQPTEAEPGAIGERTRMMDTPVTRAKSVTDDNNVRYELFEAEDGNSAIIRSMDMDSGQLVSMKKYPSLDEAQKDFVSVEKPAAPTDTASVDPASLEQPTPTPVAEPVEPRQQPTPKPSVVATKDQFGKPIADKLVKARQEFVDNAKPGSEFTWSAYPTAKFKVQPDGGILDISTGRAMGTVESAANSLKAGSVKWTSAPTDAASVPEAKAISVDDISKTVGGAGKGIVDGLYDKVWNDAQSGKLAKMDKPPLFEQLVLKGHQRGVVKSVEDVRSISEGFTGDFESDKKIGTDNLNRLLDKYKTKEATTEESASVPVMKTPEDHAAIPMFGVYERTFKGKKQYSVKEFDNKGYGDSLFDSLEEANKEAALIKQRDAERKASQEKQKADEEAATKKQAEYEASFGGFLSDKPMNKGRQLKVLSASRNYKGKVVTVKDIIEQKVADGAVVNDQGQLESPDGAYLGTDKITKIGIDYAKHLIAAKSTDAVSVESQRDEEVKDAPKTKEGGDPNEVQTEERGQKQANANAKTETQGQVGNKGGQAADNAPSLASSSDGKPKPPKGYKPLKEFTPAVTQTQSPDLELQDNRNGIKELGLKKGEAVGYRVYPKRGSINGAYWQYGTVEYDATGSHAAVKREDGTVESIGGSRLHRLELTEDAVSTKPIAKNTAKSNTDRLRSDAAKAMLRGDTEMADALNRQADKLENRTEWEQGVADLLSTVPAFKGASFEMSEADQTVKVMRPDGRMTTIHFNADASLDATAKKRGLDWAHGAYIFKSGLKNDGHIYLHSESDHVTVLNHEVVHWLEDEGIITPAEVAKYGGREGIADAYSEWVANKSRTSDTLFDKIYAFLESIFDVNAKFFKELTDRVEATKPATDAASVNADDAAMEALIEAEFDAQMGTDKQPPVTPKSDAKPIEFTELKKHKTGVTRTVNAFDGNKLLVLELNKHSYSWSIRENGKSKDIVDGIVDLKKAKNVATRIFEGTFDTEGDDKFVRTDNTSIAYSNAKLAERVPVGGGPNFAATLKNTGFFTDGRILLKVIDKDRDAILAKLPKPEGRQLNVARFIEDGREAMRFKDNEFTVAGYRGGDVTDRTVFLRNANGGFAIIDKAYHDTIIQKYPTAKFWGNAGRYKALTGGVAYSVDGEFVGVVMPLQVKRIEGRLKSMVDGTYVFSDQPQVEKPRSVKKDRKPAEKPPTKIEQARDEVRSKKADLYKQFKAELDSKPTALLNPALGKIAVEIAIAEIKDGALTFSAFVENVVSNFPSDQIENIKPYFEMAWRVAHKRGMTTDPGGKFDDFVKGKDDGQQVYSEGDGTDTEGSRGGVSDGAESGGTATPGSLEEAQSSDGQATGATEDTGGLRGSDSGSIQQGSDAVDGNVEDGDVGSTTTESGDSATGSGDGFTRPGDGSGINLAPKSSRPNFHLTDPDVIIGRGLKDKFARNVRALELSQELEESGRPPTQEELETLASYIGWGAFGQELFQGNWNNTKVKKDWESENEWLREHLGEEEWRSAQESIPNAHYTDPEVVSGIWSMIRKMGFKGGRFLEPSFGVGNFAALMPRDMMSQTNFTAIELDKATSRIAKILYPQINVQQKGYQDSRTPNDFYDVTATNVPFGDYKIVDRMYRMPYSIHNYFFRKAIDQTKPGGLMVFVTSNMTMDGKEEAKLLRKQLSDRGDLVAAFRFPTGAFEKYAKTKVVADLIIIRKRKPGEDPSPLNKEWIDIVEVDTPSGEKVDVNEYWTKHPENILGTLNHGHGTTNGRPGMIVDKPANLEALWNKAIESVPAGILNTDRTASEGKERANERKLRQNTVVHQNDELYIAKGEQLIPLKEYVNWYRSGSKEATIKKSRDEMIAILKIRDSMERVLEVQGKGDDASKERIELNNNYDAFVGKYGPITTSKSIGYLKSSGDAIANAVASLESRNANGEYEKRPVFTKTTVRQAPRVGEKLDPVDAFALARNNSINIDWDDVASMAKLPKSDVLARLQNEGLIYKTGDDSYEAADVFLSGNMAGKIRQLEAAKNEGAVGLDKAIDAAKAIMPSPLIYNQIQVSLGAPWVTAEDYSQFFADLLNEDVKNTKVLKAVKGWKVDFSTTANNAPGVVTHGHKDVVFSRMVAAAMNNGRVTVYYKDAEGNPHKDEQATLESNVKIDELKDKFKDWIWQSPDRIARLSQAYNEDHRSVATPDWKNIKVPLLFEGLALQRGDDPFSLRKHQEAAVWRAIVSGKGLFAHEVGTGKTLTMASIAIESRRLRLANKPVIFAHNANSQAVYREAQEAYPGAKILYVDNLDAKNKGQAMASIATEDWDLIVIPHSLVENLKMRPETLERLLQEQMDQLEAAALEAFNEDDSPFKGRMPENLDNIGEEDMKKLKQRTAKELVKERLRLRERIRAAQSDAANESTIFIEDMGIDMLLVDEAHIFKKIPLATRQQVKGLNKRASDIGNSLMLLSDYIRGTQNGRGIYLFTGTPITNTLNEIYNMQRFIMPDEMQAVGVKDWDGWFNTFATSETSDELSAGGTYEEFERLTSFVNMPELRASIGQYMDTVFASDMPEFIPRPTKDGRVEEGDPVIGRPYKEVHNETLQMMPIQKRLSEDLKRRYRALRDAKGKAKFEMMRMREYMPLVINTEGVKLALDPRLMDGVDEKQIDPRDPRLKVNKMILNAMEYYHSHPKATQMIFMELGHTDTTSRVVGRDNDGKSIKQTVRVFNLAKEIKRRLIEEGVPENEIAIFSAMSKEKRAEAARAMNRGEIRFAIGGTETLGTGINAQENLVAMHHLDAPWMPGALEQRNGRGHRQGNRWNTVHEHRYLTEGPQDGRRWQVLLTKDRFTYRFMHHKGDERMIDMSDVDLDEEGQGDFESTFSAAVGDPRIQQRFKLEREVDKLNQAKDRHYKTIQDSLWEASSQQQRDIPRLRDRMESYLGIQKKYQESRPEKTEDNPNPEPTLVLTDFVKIPEKNVSGSEAIAKALEYAVAHATLGPRSGKRKIAEYRGVDVFIAKDGLGSEVLFVGDVNLEIKPSFASLDGMLRNLGKRITALETDLGKKESFVKSANDSAKLPFVRQQQLEAKQKKLAALIAEIEANPEGSPFWFRNMAPIGTSIYIRKRKRADGMQAFTDMASEMHRERITGEDAQQNSRYEFEEHAVSGYRADTHVLYEDGANTVLVPASKVFNEQGEQVFVDIEELRQLNDNSSNLTQTINALPNTLYQTSSDDIDANMLVEAIDIAIAAEKSGIKTYDQLVAFSVKTIGEARTRVIGAFLYSAGKAAGMKGVRPTKDVLGMNGMTRDQAVTFAKAAFPMLSDEQIEAGIQMQDITAFGRDEIGYAPSGSPVPGQADNAKGWTSFISATRVIIGATDKADVSTFIHEFFHPMRRFLLDRSIPRSERFGITDEDIKAIEDYAGATDGNWTVEAEEKAAKAWEQYWFEGKSPNSKLDSLFEKISRWMQEVYKGIKQLTGGSLPVEVKSLFDKVVQRGLPAAERITDAASVDDSLTSIKNAVMQELIELSGRPELVDVASQTQQEWLDEAERNLRQDPMLGNRLVQELSANARNLSNIEVAVLQLHYRLMNNQLEAASDKWFAAKDSGNELQSARMKTDVDLIMKSLAELEDASKKAGREWGRAGVARQIALAKDFSLGSILRKARVANAGNELSEEQEAEMRELARQVAKLEGDLAAATQKITDLERQKNVDKGIEEEKKRVGTPAPKSKSMRNAGKVLGDFAKKFAGVFALKQTDTDTLQQTEEERMVDEAEEVVKAYVDAGVYSFGEFIAQIKKELGGDLPMQAQIAFQAAWQNIKAQGDIPSPTVDRNNAASMTRFARKIQRMLVESGITERDKVVEAVRESLAEMDIELSKREVMDALSGYGQYSQLSKDDIDIIIRDINGQLQQIAKIEDMKAGIAPSKTGGERRTPTPAERELIREVNELKRTSKYFITDPDTQLKTMIGAAMTAASNRIYDLKKALEPDGKRITQSERRDLTGQNEELDNLRNELAELTAEYRKKFPKPATTDDQRIAAAKNAAAKRIAELKAAIEKKEAIVKATVDLAGKNADLDAIRKELADVSAEYKAMFPKPGVTDAQRLAAAIRSIDREIANVEEQLSTGNVMPKGRKDAVKSDELTLKQAKLDSLREMREAMRLKQNPEYKNEVAEKLYKANLMARIADYQDRAQHQFFDPKPKKEPRKLSPEELALKKKLQDVKDEFFRLAGLYRLEHMSPAERAWDWVKESTHLSRAFMTSIDLSAVFRQGGIASFSHPKLAAEASVEMYKALKSEQAEFTSAEGIRNDALYDFAIQAGLEITTDSEKITRQEEAYMGRWAKHGFGKKGTKLNDVSQFLLTPISASARAYTSYLNSIRFKMFKQFVSTLGTNGQVTLDEAKVLATFINVSTGRGDLGKWNQAIANASLLFFAPRYVISRVQYFAFPFYTLPSSKVSGRVKKLIAQEYAKYALGLGTFMGAVVMLGRLLTDDDDEWPTVELDPRSPDFMKIKIGETRIDTTSGLSQIATFASQVGLGQKKRADGEVRDLRGEKHKWGDDNTWDVMADFVRKKFAPVPGAATNVIVGENVIGDKVTPLTATRDLFVPLSLREIGNTMQSRDVASGSIVSALAILGMGGGTYGPKTKYMISNEADRAELFTKGLKAMEWNSPDPEYQEFLTADQMEQVKQRREDRKGALVTEALGVPKRESFQSDEAFDKAVAARDEALEAFKGAGMTYEEVKQLLFSYWKRNHKSPYELSGGRWVMKDAVASRLRQAKKELGVK